MKLQDKTWHKQRRETASSQRALTLMLDLHLDCEYTWPVQLQLLHCSVLVACYRRALAVVTPSEHSASP
jgi:hypothetical protein